MTRINVIPVTDLSDNHLKGEYKELPRAITAARLEGGKKPRALPTSYTLGQGHVLFFVQYVDFLINRYIEIIKEMKRRGFKPNPHVYLAVLYSAREEVLLMFQGEYKPTVYAMAINLARINLRLAGIK